MNSFLFVLEIFLIVAGIALVPAQSELRQQPQPRHRNVYDYDGEYEFPIVQHWTAPKAGIVRSR